LGFVGGFGLGGFIGPPEGPARFSPVGPTPPVHPGIVPKKRKGAKNSRIFKRCVPVVPPEKALDDYLRRNSSGPQSSIFGTPELKVVNFFLIRNILSLLTIIS
jgi:hypothetical protein